MTVRAQQFTCRPDAGFVRLEKLARYTRDRERPFSINPYHERNGPASVLPEPAGRAPNLNCSPQAARPHFCRAGLLALFRFRKKFI
jgi:hypothetical protein